MRVRWLWHLLKPFFSQLLLIVLGPLQFLLQDRRLLVYSHCVREIIHVNFGDETLAARARELITSVCINLDTVTSVQVVKAPETIIRKRRVLSLLQLTLINLPNDLLLLQHHAEITCVSFLGNGLATHRYNRIRQLSNSILHILIGGLR